MNTSRRKNTLLNIAFGYVAQIGTLILSFIGRRIFLLYLPIDLLGVNGLYSNILSVLSLVELGLDSAVLYSLYKPVAEGNTSLVASMIRYFKKIYAILAIIIFVIGLVLLPVLKYIINSDLPQNELTLYYIIFLINTVLTYFIAHKVALLTAYQEQRIQKIVGLLSSIVLQILYITVLTIWKNYFAYLGISIFGTIVNSIVFSVLCDRKHPEVTNRSNPLIVEFDRKLILNRVKYTFPYKVGAVVVNSTDNILISVFINTAAVGLYSNYLVIVMAIQGFISTITTSMTGSLGSLCARNDNKKRQHAVFRAMLLFYHIVGAIGGIGFALLLDNFISLWLGSRYVLGQSTCIAIAINFYLTNVISPIWMFREANGLFREVRYLLLTTAGCNIVLSIILGKLMGISGILFATSISRFITQVWYEPSLLFRRVFGCSAKCYWGQQLRYSLTVVVSLFLSYCLTMTLPSDFVGFLLKAMSVAAITSILFILTNIKTEEFSELAMMINKKNKQI